MLNLCFSDMLWCLDPCWYLSVFSTVMLLMTVGVSSFNCGLVMSNCVVYVKGLMYYQVPAGILLDVLSNWLFCNCCVVRWVWQCNEMMVYGIPFFMIIPTYRKDNCDSFYLVSFYDYWNAVHFCHLIFSKILLNTFRPFGSVSLVLSLNHFIFEMQDIVA